MATYAELRLASEDPTLNMKVQVAVIISAEAIRGEANTVTDHGPRMAWAARAFLDPIAEAKRMIWAVLAANKSQTLANILAASDSTIQTNVDAEISVFLQ